MTYLSLTQHETRQRIVEDELSLAETRALGRPRRPLRRRRLLTAVRGAAAA